MCNLLARRHPTARIAMAPNDTLIFRAALEGQASIYRDIEIGADKSLYQLARAINDAFGFDFDHAFGFYSGLTPTAMMRKHPRYELFADMGEADSGVLSVKRTKLEQAFPTLGHTLLFLFDYGDEWHFRIELKGTRQKVAKVRYPRVVESGGEAPEQYPECDPAEKDQHAPRYFGKK
jgi:hypothetical protein